MPTIRPTRRRFVQASSAFGLGTAIAPGPSGAQEKGGSYEAVLNVARELAPLRTLIVARGGQELIAERFRGPALDVPVNVKSVSKSVISALVGIAIERQVLAGVGQKIVPLLGGRVPLEADPRVLEITVEDLLTMRAGLERTSGANYGSWINSADWSRTRSRAPSWIAQAGRCCIRPGATTCSPQP